MLGKEVKLLREQKNMTQAQLAQRLGVTQEYVSLVRKRRQVSWPQLGRGAGAGAGHDGRAARGEIEGGSAKVIMSIQLTPDTPATRRAFNRLAREKMKLRLLADIRMDLMVCELEGYSKLEYLDELLALVQELRKGGGEDGERGTNGKNC